MSVNLQQIDLIINQGLKSPAGRHIPEQDTFLTLNWNNNLF